MRIELQGFNALANHFHGVADTIGPMTVAILGAVADETASIARQLELPHFLTGATFFSISAGERGSGVADVMAGEGGYYADVGTVETNDPETSPSPQARLLEFGFRHVATGQFIQYPFVLPAAYAVMPKFEDLSVQMMQMAIGGRSAITSPLANAAIHGHASNMRGFLYSSSKFLGDLNVIVGSPWIGSLRSYGYMLARGMGDIDSIMRGAIGTRFTFRVAGRFTGAGISTTRSAILSGPSAQFSASSQRIYNRFAGHELGAGLRGSL